MKYSVIDDDPSVRFPVYTRGNAGEVFPNAMTPMTGSLIGAASYEGQIRALRRLGMLARSDLDGEGMIGTGVFAGHLYANLSMIRVACERVPGMSADDADRQMAGISADTPPHRPHPNDRDWRATFSGLRSVGRAVLRPDITEVDTARVQTDLWRSSVEPVATRSDQELVEFVRRYPPRFADGMERLLTFSSFAGASAAMTEQLADRTDAPAGTTIALTSGLGTIDSAAPAIKLWALGRQVATSEHLTSLFDEGADLNPHRDHPDVAAFNEQFESFLRDHGARGPDEWELASQTWGTDPGIALAAIERLRHAPDERDPLLVGQRLAAEREQRSTEVRNNLTRPLRPLFDRVARSSALYAEGRERAKAVFVDDLFPVRLALFEVADRMVGRGDLATQRDLFLVTADELPDLLADPGSLEDTITERREQQHWLGERVPPFTFEGQIPDPATWPLRDTVEPAATPAVIMGQGVCPGRARGRARIVRDPAAPGDLEPGDILVAPLTDPAWTPLFLAAAGVVVDVGAQLSHASIVARELGIPAVVGATDATRLLNDGQMIEVDGSTGTVTPV